MAGKHAGEMSPAKLYAEQYQERFPQAAHRFADRRRSIPNLCRHLAGHTPPRLPCIYQTPTQQHYTKAA